MMASDSAKSNKWRRRFFVVLALWILSTGLLSVKAVRGLVTRPLYVNHSGASGEVAYVMADGDAYWERLHAASDLYNMERVERIVILRESKGALYNFVRGRPETVVQRARDYLKIRGVPVEKISTILPHPSTRLGSLSEARGMAAAFEDVDSVVVVTSAPHTRRSLLAFRRSFPDEVPIQAYAATPPPDSAEVFDPLWVEYLKLFVYYFAA